MSAQQVSNITTPIISPEVTDTLQPLPIPTLPVAESTPTTSMLSAESQKLHEIVFDRCLTISPEPPSGNNIPWTLLFLHGNIPFAINPNTGERTEQDRPSRYATNFTISPDGKWLAYAVYSKDVFSLIVEPSGNILTNSSQGRIIWRSSWPSSLAGWINNEALMLVRNHSSENFGSTLIFNPFTREQKEFFLQKLPNYLSYQLGMSGSYLMDHGNLIPDPTLKRVVYPAWPDKDDLQLVLWDVENKRELASLRYTLSQLSRDPFWSLDGSNFLIAATKENSVEWYQVTKDGVVEQLTHFGEFLNDAEFNYPGRSWNGSHFAFQMMYNSRKNSKYIFFDLAPQSLDGFCLNLGGEGSGSLHSPVWSPDNKYVAITNGTYSDNSTDVIVVDLEQRVAFYIAHDDHAAYDTYAIGWTVKP